MSRGEDPVLVPRPHLIALPHHAALLEDAPIGSSVFREIVQELLISKSVHPIEQKLLYVPLQKKKKVRSKLDCEVYWRQKLGYL